MVYTHHTTCSVVIQALSTDETYAGLAFLQQDLLDIFDRIIPVCRKEGRYLHPGPKATIFAAEHGEDKPEALNTDAHLRSSILRRSVPLTIKDGKLVMPQRGDIYFIDFDQTRERVREIEICAIGK